MAVLLPPEPGDEVASSAERRLFLTFGGLSDDWTVLHSVGIARHRRKRWAEADFVLVGPPGVFVIEVKGGRVARTDGQWTFTDRNDRESTKNEGPFEQAGGAAGALQAHLKGLRRDRPGIPAVQVGWAVMMPDITFDAVGPDVEPGVLFDARHSRDGIDTFVRRVADYWNGQWATPPSRLGAGDRSAVVWALRPDFDFRPSLRHRADRINEELLRLTREQYRVLDGLEDNERVIVRGAAGTGKTLLAVEEARRQARNGRRVLLTCYNRALARYLRRACGDVEEITVSNFHGLLRDLVRTAGLEQLLPDASERDLFTVFYPVAALEAIETLGLGGDYDVVIVDEAQDLMLADYAAVMDALVAGGIAEGSWRLFLDSAQDLFTGLDKSILRRFVGAHPASYRLSVNCRNTQQIAAAAALLSGVDLAEASTHGPDVAVVFHRVSADLRRRVAKSINRLLSDRLDNERFVILSPVHLHNSGLAAELPGLRLPLVEGDEPSSDPESVSYRTIGSFKGLEADVVLLVDIDDLDRIDDRAAVYVGGSRARVLLEVHLPSSLEPRYQELAIEFGRRLADLSDEVSGAAP